MSLPARPARRCPTLAELPPPPPGKTGWPWTHDGPVPAPRENVAYPPISIVTPSYNQGHYLEQTIRSVLLQGYPALQYIVIDGGSTDASVDILRKYHPWLAYWVSEPDAGQTDAINKGFARCTGQVFNWLNSDDYYQPGALLAVGSRFGEDPRTEVVCGAERIFKDADPGDWQLGTGSSVRDTLEQTIFTGHIDQPPTFFRRAAIQGLLPLSAALKYLMDVELWLRYLLAAGQDRIVRTDEVLVNFRLHDQSKTVSQARLFKHERAGILRSLGEQIGVPGYVLALLPVLPGFHPRWEVSARVDRGKLVALYAHKYAGVLFNQGQYRRCRQCVYLVVKAEPRRLKDKSFLRLALASLLPPPVLTRLRRPARTG